MATRYISSFTAIVTVGSALALTSIAASAATITTLYNTGVNNSHVALTNGQLDSHYAITSTAYNGPAQALVGVWPANDPWVADSSTSAWIRPNNNTNPPNDAPDTTFLFATSFNLAGYDKNSAIIAGQWSTDNWGRDIIVNGQSTGKVTGNSYPGNDQGFTAFYQFTIPTSLLVDGINTIVFELLNGSGSGNPAGLRVEFNATADVASVPLPAPVLLFATGLGALGLVARCRRKRRLAAA